MRVEAWFQPMWGGSEGTTPHPNSWELFRFERGVHIGRWSAGSGVIGALEIAPGMCSRNAVGRRASVG
jgi:hypothetical protein